MRIRVTREWIFELPDDIDRKKLENEVHWFFQGADSDLEEVDSGASWCILTPEGLPISPSQYPKADAS